MVAGDLASSAVPTPSLEEFRIRCREWLEANAKLRESGPRKLPWGEGSDSVALFHNLSYEQELALVEDARRWQRLKADAGFASITWEPEYGGLGLSGAYDRVYRTEEARFAVPSGHEIMSISSELAAATIRAYGTPEQRAFFVEALRRADLLMCQMFSEPGAGSDLASLSTRAVQDGDGWLLTGQKVWTSGAQYAEWGYVLARTGDATDRHAGITAFLVPMDSPGVDVRPLRQMSGGSSFNEVFLDSVRVPDSNRLGGVGEGWRVAKTTLSFERGPSATNRVGAGWQRVLGLAHHVGVEDDPVARQLLAKVYTSMQLVRYTTRRTAASVRAGQTPGPEGSIIKLAWAQQLQLVSEAVTRLLGPRLIADTEEWGMYSWSEHVTGAPGYRIAGGSDEVQRNVIGERVLGLPPEPKAPASNPGTAARAVAPARP